MNTLQRGIITLLRSGLTGESLSLPETFSFSQAYPVLCAHQVHTLAYDGAVCCGIPKTLPEMKLLFQVYCQCLMLSERQMQTVEMVFHAFEEQGISYLPVKGCHLKKLYPKPELRLMGDADILIRAKEYPKVSVALQNLGYQEVSESEKDYGWHSPALYMEIHHQLIGASDRDFYQYFGDGWKLAKPLSGKRYALSLEDEYIYLVMHLAKHYRNGGIGLRHVTDLWVYRRAYPNLNEAYIVKGLQEMHLVEFYQNLRRLISVWFEAAPEDEITAFMTDIIFNSGAWGNTTSGKISVALRNKNATGNIITGKMKRIWNGFFPPYGIMWEKYPILKKCPVLLPVFWPVRWVTAVLFRRDNLRRQYKELQMTTADAVETYQQALHYVGLDFHFKED